MTASIMLVDDDPDFLELMTLQLNEAGYRHVSREYDPLRAAREIEAGADVDLALIDMTMPEMDGLTLLDRIKASRPYIEIIMITAVDEVRAAVACLRRGAYDYLVKPVEPEALLLALRRALERKRLLDVVALEKGEELPELKNPTPFVPIITRSAQMRRVMKEAELHAASDVPVLITGESGTGKELMARAMHAASPRAQHPFTPINMASVAAGLFEAEFFGHTRGAFTGAERQRSGYLESGDRGTLFLDEIGNLEAGLQGKLLRVLQDGEYRQLGASRHQRADVRFIAATNENLAQLVERRQFRPDLYYRIRGGWLRLPSLRERKEDIPVLVATFLERFQPSGGKGEVDREAMCLLVEHDYPGNVRELMTVIQTAVNLAQGGPITIACLPKEMRRSSALTTCRRNFEGNTTLPLAEVEKRHILNVYHQSGANKSQTARSLGIGLNTLRRRLKQYGTP